MTTEERVKELNKKAVKDLIAAHKQRTDEPLILAVRYRLDDDPFDIHLLEVLKDFPGGKDDELLMTEFEPSAQLRILGKLHLVLGSPDQLKSALKRNDDVIRQIKGGELVHDDGSSDASQLKEKLDL